jgi:hypothetical protein
MKERDPLIAGVHPGKNGEPTMVVTRARAPLYDPDPDVREAFLLQFYRQLADKGVTADETDEAMRTCHSILGSAGGKIGGRSRSEAKIAAARNNGALGGRPKGSKNLVQRRSETSIKQSSQNLLTTRDSREEKQ